jgi:ABC-type polysaccharide/polyol phosphate export permease
MGGVTVTSGLQVRMIGGTAGRSMLAEFRELVHELISSRELLRQLTIRDIKLRYKQAVMGFGWALLMPILVVSAGGIVRLAISSTSGHGLTLASLAGVTIKSIPWAFFVGSVSFATASLTGNTNLVSKVYFPREVLPLSAVLAQGVDSLVSSVVVAVALPFMGAKLSWALAWIPLLALMLFMLTAASCLFLSCANLFFRDVKYVVQVLLMFGIFFTPVFYEPGMLGAGRADLVMLNPIAPLLEGARLALMDGHNLLLPLDPSMAANGTDVWSPWYLAYSCGWAVLGLVGGTLIFHRVQYLFAEYL